LVKTKVASLSASVLVRSALGHRWPRSKPLLRKSSSRAWPTVVGSCVSRRKVVARVAAPSHDESSLHETHRGVLRVVS
jgi:hypothetical protein